MHKTKKVVTFDLMQSLRGAVWKSCSENFSGKCLYGSLFLQKLKGPSLRIFENFLENLF